MPDIATNLAQPRSTYTLADLQDRVLGDIELRGSLRVQPIDVQKWANEAQDKLAKLTLWCQDILFTDAISGQREYVMPQNVLTIRNVIWLTRPLVALTMEELNVLNYYWRSAGTGQPIAYYTRGATAFGVYYTPSSGIINAFTIDVAIIPPKVSAPLDQFYVPVAAEDAIIIYCKLMASVKDAHGEGKARIPIYKQLWDEAVMQLKQQVDSIEWQHPTIFGGDSDYGNVQSPHLFFNPYTKLGPGS